MESDVNQCKTETARRFLNENLGIHWQVDETRESFDRLLHHLEVKTRVKPYFEEAVRHLNLDAKNFTGGLVVADIGAGVCWTSGILAGLPTVKRVYAVDPSKNRLAYGGFVAKHFKAENKIKIIQGTFLEPNIPEKVDLIVMCGSIHHCYDNQLEGLFLNVKRLLKPGGIVLIACEHYVNWVWILKRVLSYIKHFKNRSALFYYPLNKLRVPDPFGGEHWRTRRELSNIFKKNGLAGQFFVHGEDMCMDKPTLYQRVGWRYYYAILRKDDNISNVG